ncbi:MAG TPA: tetratricopeptide repeat protein [Candidatus Polarisedimenticolia bacterium]|nr:tetratricopeptide repeat protein [Candidatus Polarisedimenticolia bacterium]
MHTERIKALLDDASERYNEGAYDVAIERWREVQSLDPGNQQAREGIRMATLLVADAEEPPGRPAPPEDRPAAPPADATVKAGIARVRELLAAGQLDEAGEGCALLEELAPGVPEIAELAAEVRSASGAPRAPASLGGDPLAEARAALAEGREADAARAARRALQLDPGSMEACGILSLTGEPSGDAAVLESDAATGRFAVASREAALASTVAPEDTAPQPVASLDRVAALIAQGQAAFDEGRLQDAISTWSRVFAVDQAHAEAGALIDKAKAALEEQSRHVDDLFYRAMDAQEARKTDEAVGLLEEVLVISPSHPEARAYLDELKSGRREDPPVIAVNAEAAQEAAKERARHEPFEPDGAESIALAPIPATPRPAPAAKPRPPRPAAPAPVAPSGRAGRGRFLATAAGALLVLGAGAAAYLWLGMEGGSMPEARATASVAPRPQVQPPQPPAQPTLPGPLELEVVPGTAPKPAAPTAPSDDLASIRAQASGLRSKGRQHYEQGRWAEAILTFREALRIDPADFDAQDLLDKAMIRLEKQAHLEKETDQATRYFMEGDYAAALHKFYRLQQDHPGMREIEVFIRNAWFNWGVMLLQSGAVDEAAEKFTEVLELSPGDATASRARDVARRYHGRQRDSVLDSFASSLRPRTIDQR